ncbi:hypothetical protein [Phenylobacterium sp.]|uniref:hypothetical protein n=1 Tax=Phenylobacterium sp. TaxID=1871053 RepID=UPI0027345AFD|nr:hypothetical protein [Phenylobacterium sp.]MDP3853861.1 hypothetical protein [Phenylobacterium sp.]
MACAIAVVSFLHPAAARAAWIKAETDRFIVYGDGRDKAVRNLAERLTIFDATLRILNPAVGQGVPQRKLEVYLVADGRELRRVEPRLDDRIGGFYRAAPQATFAVVRSSDSVMGADDVLFHEYAHHFMLENFPAAYPGWFIEGWAEYFMTAEVTWKGVKVGGYNENRAYWLFHAPWLPLETVLSKSPSEIEPAKRHIYYGQAWLLMHYMRGDPARVAQINKATRAIAAGEPPVKAMQEATGLTILELTKALRGYRRLPMLMVKPPMEGPPQVTITPLPATAEAFLLDNLRLATASVAQPDAALLADIRTRAARYPGDRLAELTLARAEFNFGDTAAGEAIAQCRLKEAPGDVELLYLAGMGQILAAERAPDTHVERLRAARKLLGKAYALDQDDYRILLAYAYSRSAEPAYPTENDLNVLLEARALAPSVQMASVWAGAALIKRDRRDQAVGMLSGVANNPHGGPLPAQARALLAGKSMAEASRIAAAEPDEPGPGEPEKPPAPAKPAK